MIIRRTTNDLEEDETLYGGSMYSVEELRSRSNKFSMILERPDCLKFTINLQPFPKTDIFSGFYD